QVRRGERSHDSRMGGSTYPRMRSNCKRHAAHRDKNDTRGGKVWQRVIWACDGVDSASTRGYAQPYLVFGELGDSMRFIAAIGLAALAASCAPKLEFIESSSNVQQTAPRLAQGTDEEIEAAASAAPTAKPAVRNARPSAFRIQT